jgi:hypothetical protein
MHHELHLSDTKIARMTTKQCKKRKAAGQKKCELTIFVGHNAALASGDRFLKVYQKVGCVRWPRARSI